MRRRRISKLRRQLEQLRARGWGIKPRELESIATSVGRKPANRGKEPTFTSERPGWRPLSIPAHPELKRQTAANIIDQLELDLDQLEDELGGADDDDNDDTEDEQGHEDGSDD